MTEGQDGLIDTHPFLFQRLFHAANIFQTDLMVFLSQGGHFGRALGQGHVFGLAGHKSTIGMEIFGATAFPSLPQFAHRGQVGPRERIQRIHKDRLQLQGEALSRHLDSLQFLGQEH